MPGSQSMHIAVIASRQGGKVYTSKLLRQSYRKDGKVQKRTLATNLSHLDDGAIALIQGHLRGKTFIEAQGGGVEILASRSHGAVAAVTGAFHELGFANLVSSRPSRQRDLVCAMVAARIIRPHTKLATTRWWHTSTLARTCGVDDAGVDELYRAMDWLLERQNRIQGKLARRLFRDDALVLFDLSSTYVEGEHCPLARRGHNRDGKRGKLQVNFGLLCDVRGRPAAVSVYPGNTGDTRTILPEVQRLQKRFGLPGSQPRHQVRSCRGHEQRPRHPAHEGLRHDLGPIRRAGHPLPAGPRHVRTIQHLMAIVEGTLAKNGAEQL